MRVLSRELISDNFTGSIFSPRSVNETPAYTETKESLCEKIDYWKYVLIEHCGAKKGDKVLLGSVSMSSDYVALAMAAAELSLIITVVDIKQSFINRNEPDMKLKLLSPIDLYFHDIVNLEHEMAVKFRFFIDYSEKAFYIGSLQNIEITDKERFEEIRNIRPDPSDVVMLCTSSGTVSTPKVIAHTHEYFYELCKRNAKLLSGNVLHSQNLNHGSSASVFFFPSFCSDDVNHMFHAYVPGKMDNLVLSLQNTNLNETIFAHRHIVDTFFESMSRLGVKYPDLNIKVLSYIPSDYIDKVKDGTIKSIESIFGCNETCGPLLTNKLTAENADTFDATIFQMVDDFYNITPDKQGLLVELPTYNKVVNTKDIFDIVSDGYKHVGRSDILRVNDVDVDQLFIQEISKKYDNNLIVVIDILENLLYLALSPAIQNIEQTVDEINLLIRERHGTDRLNISKYDVLDLETFVYGVKIDNELLREHFRRR